MKINIYCQYQSPTVFFFFLFKLKFYQNQREKTKINNHKLHNIIDKTKQQLILQKRNKIKQNCEHSRLRKGKEKSVMMRSVLKFVRKKMRDLYDITINPSV